MPVAAEQVSDDDVAAFERRGFLALPTFIGEPEVARLRDVYDAILEREVVAAGDRMLGGITRQVMGPSTAAEAFDDNEALDAGRRIARQLLGDGEIVRTFDMLIFKPPGHPHETPWHQDLAYTGRPFAPAGAHAAVRTLQFWVALDDADVENGCMHFVPRADGQPLLPHRIASGDPAEESRLLELVDPEADLDLTSVVSCPLPAGGATVHAFGTPHHTPPNRSVDRPRRAYIFNLAMADDLSGMGLVYKA